MGGLRTMNRVGSLSASGKARLPAVTAPGKRGLYFPTCKMGWLMVLILGL